jgi:hypothetical protein
MWYSSGCWVEGDDKGMLEYPGRQPSYETEVQEGECMVCDRHYTLICHLTSSLNNLSNTLYCHSRVTGEETERLATSLLWMGFAPQEFMCLRLLVLGCGVAL